ncbi:unnamed protein product [Rotaria magnacalcarata]|uniref:Uncharacterized protein n=4 Tax=Rotaria magnacalcarata TaxID=392030 RepID=A0A816XGF0_9BILA|nr:unnamed protein product [Rotaria magnacalcarata]CAF4146461.1 unnamed protein product [Rotaria magnacalcarata]
MSNKKISKNDDGLNLIALGVPSNVTHMKSGNTLCSNDSLVILQNGATTLEIRTAPKFEAKQIPWHDGLIRDIVWNSELNVFVLLTKKSLFTFDSKTIDSATVTANNDSRLKIKAYSNIKPYNDKALFWRCTCVGTKLFISYSGFSTVIDEYILEPSSCTFVKRYAPPQTCANHEGIWCIRTHPNTEQIGMTVMNPNNNGWRFETRDPNNLAHIWETRVPIANGDGELTPLADGDWLIVNSCGTRFIQISNLAIKYVVEYERELKNAISFSKDYFIVRTKNTLEIHLLKKEDD